MTNPALLLCLLLPACGAGGIAVAASGGGGGGGGGSTRPPPPQASIAPPTEALSSNYVALSYNLRDPQVRSTEEREGGDSDPRVRIRVQFKTQILTAKGTLGFVSFWTDMTEADVSTSDGTRGLPLGDRRFVWNAAADLGRYAGRVRVRVQPEYELSAGFARKFKVRETEFAIDNNEAGTILGGDVVPLSEVTTFPVDLRATGGNLFAASLGGGIVERVGPTGAIDRLVGLGVPGTTGDGGNPGVARLSALRGLEVDAAGNVFTLHDSRIRLTNRSGAPFQIGTLTVAPDTIESVQDSTGGTLGLVFGRGPRIHTPTGALLYTNTTPGTFVTEIHAYNVEPLGGATIVLGGVSIDPGFDAVIVGGGSDDSDGNLGTDTEVVNGLGLAVGPDGEIYFLEKERHRVRVFNPGTTSVTVGGASVAAGTVLTIAGGNGAGSAGDGGPAVAASLSGPEAIDVDANRNLFIADLGNLAVRMANLGAAPATFAGVIVDPGNVATIVGGRGADLKGVGSLAPETKLTRPNAVAVDDDGNVLIADNDVVVLANGTDATVTRYGVTVAAGRTVEVYDPTSRGGIPLVAPRAVRRADDGLVYFTDRSTVRAYSLLEAPTILGSVRLDHAKTAVVAGGSVPGFSGDVQTGVGADGDAVLAAFSNPAALVADSRTALYVADTGNDRIRFVNLNDASPLFSLQPQVVLGKTIPSGKVDTVIGGGVGPLPDDGDGLVASDAVLDGPMGIDVGNVNVDTTPTRAIFVADTGNHRIRVANKDPADITVMGIVIAPNTIQTIIGDGTPGFTPDGAGPWQIDSPTEVIVDNDGVIFFADSGNHRIRALNPGGVVRRRAGIDIPPGEIRTIVGNGAQGRDGDGGLAPDASVDTPQSFFIQTIVTQTETRPIALYFSDPPQHVVRMVNLSDEDRFLRVDADGGTEITPAGGIKTLVGGPNRFGTPNAPAFGGDGQDQSQIRFASPWGIAILIENERPTHLFVGDRDNNRLRRIGVRSVGVSPDDP